MARTGLDAYYFRGIPLAATAPSNGDVYVYDSTSMTWIPGPAGGGAITGTIAVTQVAYGAGADEIKGEAAFTYDEGTNTLTAGTLNSTSLTASEILITDASKNVVSAAVATYPSLTELSYVKGVTSAIQTQLNAKGDVSKVGTPANDQIGVWTGDGTLEGTDGLTYSGTLLTSTATTEQFRAAYDSSNYFSTTVASDGGVTFNAVGAGALFTFSDDVRVTTAGTNTASVVTVGGTQTLTNKRLTTPTFIGNTDIEVTGASLFSGGLSVYKRGTTGDANAAVAINTELGFHSFYGWNGSAYNRGAYTIAKATEAFTGSAAGTYYAIATVPNGSTTAVERLKVDQNGNVGIGTSTVSARLHSLSTTEQLRLGYDASNYASFTTSSGGDLTIAPSGGNMTLSGTLTQGTGVQAFDTTAETFTFTVA